MDPMTIKAVPTIDGRRGKIKVRESLEEQTMNMAKAAKVHNIYTKNNSTYLINFDYRESRIFHIYRIALHFSVV